MPANPDGVSNQGEYHGKIHASEPMTTKGHAPGVLVGNDALPEFNLEVLPAGSAPPDQTFEPNPDASSERSEQGSSENDNDGVRTSAQESVPGATSADVHKGLGHPGSGQTATDNKTNTRQGLEGAEANDGDWIKDRGLDSDHRKGGKPARNTGDVAEEEKQDEFPPAEDKEPVTAEALAAEFS